MYKIITMLVPLLLFTTKTVAIDDIPTTLESDDRVQIFNILAESYSFTPNRIVVRVGLPVVLIIEKKGIIPHDLIIDDPASGLTIKKALSGTTKISFTPMKRGKFEFYCGKDLPFVKSHYEKGMHGILEVR